jgi:hypothetical protein
MTDLDKLTKYYNDNHVKFHLVKEDGYTGIAPMAKEDTKGFIFALGQLWPITKISQLVSFVEFEPDGSLASISKSLIGDCIEAGIYHIPK